MRALKRILTVGLAAAVLLSGCGKKKTESTSAEKESTVVTSTPSPTAEPVPTEAVPTPEPDPDHYAFEEYEVVPGVYDLLALTDAPAGSKLVCASFADSKNAVLVYASSGDDSVTVEKLNLLTGDTESMCKDYAIKNNPEIFSLLGRFDIISVEPLIVLDDTSRVLYDITDKKEYEIPDIYSGKEYFCINNTLYTADGYSFYRIEGEEKTRVFSLPAGYGSLMMGSTFGDSIISEVYASVDGESTALFAKINPQTGEMSCKTEGLSDECPCGGNNGKIVYMPYADDGTIIDNKYDILDYDTGEVCSVTIPDGIDGLEKVQYEYGEMSAVSISEVTACGSLLIIPTSTGLEEIEHLYIADTGKVEDVTTYDSGSTDFTINPSYSAETAAKIKKVEDKYNITIVAGNLVEREQNQYLVDLLEDDEIIGYALKDLDYVLSFYPEGFFDKIQNIGGPLRIHLCGAITGNSGSSIPSAAAFVDDAGSAINLVIDVSYSYGDYNSNQVTYCHELTHVCDDCLERLGMLDEDEWASMNPDGFSYNNKYVDENGEELMYLTGSEYTMNSDEFFEGIYDNVYFVDNYAKNAATEDRARLMEGLIIDDYYLEDYYWQCPHIKEKQQYYFALLRKAFGDDSWDVTPPFWEAKFS